MKNKFPIFTSRRGCALSATTLVEIMVSVAVGSLVLAALCVSLVTLQGSFQAALYQLDSQGDENRVLACLTRDLHQASSLQISPDGTSCTLTIPSTTAPTLNLDLGLSLLSLLSPPSSSAGSTTVQYSRQGNSIIRSSGSQTTELSSSATMFQVSLTGSLARVDVAFQPRFSMQTSTAAPPAVQVTAFANLLNSQN